MSGCQAHSHRAHTRRVPVLVAVAAAILIGQHASATPTGVSFVSITPSDGATLFVARTAANNPLDPPTFQLKADLFFDNFSGADAEVTDVTFRYPGSSIPETSNTPKQFIDTDADKVNDTAINWTLEPGSNKRLAIHHGLDTDLPTPLPATVEIDIEFNNDGNPLTLTYNLAFYENRVPLKGHFFPAKAEDLDAGELWYWGTRHSVDSGGGVGGSINPSTQSQRYALDMGVVAWDGAAWSESFDGTYDENTDYRVWDKPLYAMGDGMIVACYRGEPDESPKGFDEIDFHFPFGNSLFIQYGDDLVSIGHMQKDTVPEALCPTPPSPGPGLWPDDDNQTGLSIPVVAGQFLGRVGNTGRSTAPHIHFQVEGVPPSGPNTISGAPMQFVNIRALADDTSVSNLGESPALQSLQGMTLHRRTLVLPNPCGFDLPPAGALEVSRHGISAECYQDVFNTIVARGYAPKFVDGYDVGGATFFNATFHPEEAAWVARHGLSGDEYQDLFEDLTAEGYRLHQIDSYLDGGSVRYAAIFEKRPGHPFAAFHGLDDADYAVRVGELKDAGFVPVNVSTVEVGGSLYWTGLFEQAEVTGWTIQSVPVADYQDTYDENVDAGRLPLYVNGFSTGAGPYLTGIWVDSIGGGYAAVHGRSGDEYQDDWEANTGAGRFTRYTTGYDDGAGSALFAAVWRGRPNTSITGTPQDPTNQTAATFTFTSGNPFATFECRRDGGAFTDCDSPRNLAGLPEGIHIFEVRALDRDRVRDLSAASFTWLVDTTPPEITISEPGVNTKTVNGVFKIDPVAITTIVGWGDVAAGVTDNLSGVATVLFKVDGVPVPGSHVSKVGNAWRFTFEPNQKNQHIYAIEVIATDHAGNVATEAIDILGLKTSKKQ
jgi:murein DD-endopeptidase MepM/ murein hydrolase activator NlpD